jgi:hypothetical protein
MAAQSNDPVVRLTDVFNTYKVGEVDVPAVKGASSNIPRRFRSRSIERRNNSSSSTSATSPTGGT